MPDYIRRKRKKKARAIRSGSGVRENQDNTVSTHLMEWGDEENKKGKKIYTANPTIFPKEGGGYYSPKDEGKSAYSEAKSRGEVFEFKRKKKAEKFAAGSWKKGEDRKEAMKGYRERKKARKKASK